MWFDAPASSCGPHFDGHHLSVLNFGAAGCACADAIGARPNLPCAAPANTTPAAPAIPAVLRKVLRSAAGEQSEGSAGKSAESVISLPPLNTSSAVPCSLWKTIGPARYNVQAMSNLFDRDRSAERLPVSLITGFLCSGKTTLLNRLLQRPEMADSAVIINEFGEIALDHLLVAPVAGETVVLASGCLCCAVRGDLQDTVRRLLIERDRGDIPAFSRILIETSGLADPAPVAQL